MANRMIHTPSFLATADIPLYWTTQAGMKITSGWYLSNVSASDAIMTKTFDAQAGWTVGMKFKYGGSSTSPDAIIDWMDGLAHHCDLRFTGSTGVFTVTRNGTTIATGTTPIAVNTEYYIEFKTVIADSPSGVAILHIDGVVDAGINSTALDTRNANNASANILSINLGRATGNIIQVRDIYVNDNSGGVDDTFWGPITVVTLSPTGAGNKSQWTPSASTNVSNVDDATPDGDSTYNATSTNGNIDSFVMSDTGYAAGTVLGVECVADIRKTDASGTARVAPLYRIGSTDYPRTDISPTTTYLLQSQRDRQSPATSAAWTVSELDGMEVGYKRTAA